MMGRAGVMRTLLPVMWAAARWNIGKAMRRAGALPLPFLLAACGAATAPSQPPAPPLGLFTTLPILWRETPAAADLLRSDAPPHWALPVLARAGAVRPLDILSTGENAGTGAAGLTGLGVLVMAQPRPLAPSENVALDTWVRGGGHVLLFADPLLTAESGYALGDRRRPQDVVLLSPILGRWGLRLEFPEDQPLGERAVTAFGARIPVNLPGRLVLTGLADCVLDGAGIAARCAIGRGLVVVVADAALFDQARDGENAGRAAALAALLDTARGVY